VMSDNDEMDCQCHACTGFCMYDGNSGTEPDNPGYPCRDQIGHSGGETIFSEQELIPAMGWDNLLNNSTNIGFQVNAAFSVPTHAAVIKLNRDFYNDVDANGNPIAFNQQTGYYTAQYNDNGTMKEWKYKPYIFPHPLTLASFGTTICAEGQITSACWCEGEKTNGYCCHGYFQTTDCSVSQARCTPGDGDIDCDGDKDIIDIQISVNIFLGIENDSAKKTRANMDNTGEVTISDIQKIVNLFLGIN